EAFLVSHLGLLSVSFGGSFRGLFFRGAAFGAFEAGHLELGQLGAVTGAFAVALLRLVFEVFVLGPAQVARHFGLDFDFRQVFRPDDHVTVTEEHRTQGYFVALFDIEPVDEQGRALLDLVLLSTAFNDRVHACSGPLPITRPYCLVWRANAPDRLDGRDCVCAKERRILARRRRQRRFRRAKRYFRCRSAARRRAARRSPPPAPPPRFAPPLARPRKGPRPRRR